MHKIGVIGSGIMGRRMISGLRRHPQFAPPAVWDINPQATQKIQNEFGDVSIISDVASLITRSDVEAIYIATPPSTHIVYCRQALAVGKPIFCEKPLAVDVSEAQKLLSEVEAAYLPTAMNFPFATLAAVKKIESQLQASELGELVRLEIRFHFATWPRGWQQNAATWLGKRAEGGFLREVFSHFVYLTHKLIGPMALQSKQVTFPDDGETAETQVMAQFRCGNVPVLVIGGVGGAAPDYNSWTMYGSQRSVRLYNWRNLQNAVADEEFADVPEEGFVIPLSTELDALAAMLRGEAHDLPDLAAGLAVQQVVESLLTP